MSQSNIDLKKAKRRLEERFERLKLSLENNNFNKIEYASLAGVTSSGDSQKSQNLERLELESHRINHEIQSIKSALFRIETGVYGICNQCNDQIPQERLDAIPEAIKCLSCLGEQEKMDKKVNPKGGGFFTENKV